MRSMIVIVSIRRLQAFAAAQRSQLSEKLVFQKQGLTCELFAELQHS